MYALSLESSRVLLVKVTKINGDKDKNACIYKGTHLPTGRMLLIFKIYSATKALILLFFWVDFHVLTDFYAFFALTFFTQFF